MRRGLQRVLHACCINTMSTRDSTRKKNKGCAKQYQSVSLPVSLFSEQRAQRLGQDTDAEMVYLKVHSTCSRKLELSVTVPVSTPLQQIRALVNERLHGNTAHDIVLIRGPLRSASSESSSEALSAATEPPGATLAHLGIVGSTSVHDSSRMRQVCHSYCLLRSTAPSHSSFAIFLLLNYVHSAPAKLVY